MLNNQKGFLLISVIFIMILMAVSIFSINYYSITQIRMSSNRADSVQTAYDLTAIVEESVWKLTDNLFWRTVEAGEDVPGNTNYTRIVRNSNTAPFNYPSDYGDAVTVQVTPKGASQSLQRSFRYYAVTLAGLSLDHPKKIFMMPSGNLLIADTGHNKILRVNPDTSAITIIAGTGIAGYDRDGWFSGVSRPQLNYPQGICTDSTGAYYYIADTDNHRIRRVYYWGGGWWYVQTVAGTGSGGYNQPSGDTNIVKLDKPGDVELDSSGNLYIADTKNDCIRKVNLLAETISIVAGTGNSSGYSGDGGPATLAQLNEPSGICLDSTKDNLYIADTKNDKIRKVNLSTGIISTVITAALDEPGDIFVDHSNNIFIADQKNDVIRMVNAVDGSFHVLAGTGSSGDTTDLPAVQTSFDDPSGIAMASAYGGRRIFISDTASNKIKVLLLKPVYGL